MKESDKSNININISGQTKFTGGVNPHGTSISVGNIQDDSVTLKSEEVSDISDILNALHENLASLPEEFEKAKNDVQEQISTLSNELKNAPEVSRSKVRDTLAALLSAVLYFGGGVAVAADLLNNTFQLADRFQIQVEEIQPQFGDLERSRPNLLEDYRSSKS
ncbi:MAG: hypothetical protein ACFB2W_28280 [Leptolyngbyaceae cyanobacterium]